MISFLKSFFANEKSAEEQALLAAAAQDKARDILTVPGSTPEDGEEKSSGGCGGCGNCHCGNAQAG